MNIVRVRGALVGMVTWGDVALVLGTAFVAGFVFGVVWL